MNKSKIFDRLIIFLVVGLLSINFFFINLFKINKNNLIITNNYSISYNNELRYNTNNINVVGETENIEEDKENLINYENIRELSNVNINKLNKYISNNNIYIEDINYLLDIENKYNINAIILLNIELLNKGYNNYISNEDLEYTAKLLNDKYLNINGEYYEGLSINNVNMHYASDNNWSSLIIKLCDKMVSSLDDE